MNIYITSFISLLSGLAIFMVGIHQMSTGLEKLSSKRLQRGMQKVSNNRFISFGFGTFITGIMQSSTLITVMTISFLNANLLTLYQGIAIVLGANIGTTLTALISSFGALNFGVYLSLFIVLGVCMEMFSKKPLPKKIGQIFIGFGLIFFGLSFASSAFKTDEMKLLISQLFEVVNFPILLILLSIILTAVVHSSSLVVGLSIILVSTQTIPLQYAIFVVLGAEVGTTMTGVIASLAGNTSAKRLAFTQFIFNVLGCIIFTIITWIFTDDIVNLLNTFDAGFQVAMFQIVFNVSTALVALIFIKQLEKLAILVIKDKDSKNGGLRLQYVNDSLLATPSFALAALNKEVLRMFDLTRENLTLAFQSITQGSPVNENTVNANEETIDYLNTNIALYLVKLSSERLAYQDELGIGRLYHLINDLERIADHANNFVRLVAEMKDEKLTFSIPAKNEIQQLTDQVSIMYDMAVDIFINEKKNLLNELSGLEVIIDKNQVQFEKNHVKRLRTGECLLEHSKYFYDLTTQLERIGDHLINIGYSIVSVVGNEADNDQIKLKIRS